jgi:hypothetical protein
MGCNHHHLAGAGRHPDEAGSGRQATFSYSTDGTTFTPLGPAFTLGDRPNFFMGYRFAIFNHATAALGGAVTVDRFSLTTPDRFSTAARSADARCLIGLPAKTFPLDLDAAGVIVHSPRGVFSTPSLVT